MTLATILAMMMQVGPNPSPSVDQNPADIVQRTVPRTAGSGPPRSSAERDTWEARRAQVRECIEAAYANADTALQTAQAGIDRLQGDQLALARECSAHALYVKGNFAEAAGNFTAAFQDDWQLRDSELVSRRAITGSAQLLAGDPAGALATYDALLAHLADRTEPAYLRQFITNRALAQVELGQLDAAEASLQTARRVASDDAAVWLYSATLSRRMDRLDDAQRQIAKAADVEVAQGFTPLAPYIGLEAGKIAALSGNVEVARKSFQSVIDLAPDSAEAMAAKGYLEQLAEPVSP